MTRATGCSDSADEVQEPERREQDKSRIRPAHQCALKNPWDTVSWREEGAEELTDASSLGELTHALHTTCNATPGTS